MLGLTILPHRQQQALQALYEQQQQQQQRRYTSRMLSMAPFRRVLLMSLTLLRHHQEEALQAPHMELHMVSVVRLLQRHSLDVLTRSRRKLPRLSPNLLLFAIRLNMPVELKRVLA